MGSALLKAANSVWRRSWRATGTRATQAAGPGGGRRPAGHGPGVLPARAEAVSECQQLRQSRPRRLSIQAFTGTVLWVLLARPPRTPVRTQPGTVVIFALVAPLAY